MEEARTWKKRTAVSIRLISESLQCDPSFMSGAEGGFCSGFQNLISKRNTVFFFKNKAFVSITE